MLAGLRGQPKVEGPGSALVHARPRSTRRRQLQSALVDARAGLCAETPGLLEATPAGAECRAGHGQDGGRWRTARCLLARCRPLCPAAALDEPPGLLSRCCASAAVPALAKTACRRATPPRAVSARCSHALSPGLRRSAQAPYPPSPCHQTVEAAKQGARACQSRFVNAAWRRFCANAMPWWPPPRRSRRRSGPPRMVGSSAAQDAIRALVRTSCGPHNMRRPPMSCVVNSPRRAGACVRRRRSSHGWCKPLPWRLGPAIAEACSCSRCQASMRAGLRTGRGRQAGAPLLGGGVETLLAGRCACSTPVPPAASHGTGDPMPSARPASTDGWSAAKLKAHVLWPMPPSPRQWFDARFRCVSASTPSCSTPPGPLGGPNASGTSAASPTCAAAPARRPSGRGTANPAQPAHNPVALAAAPADAAYCILSPSSAREKAQWQAFLHAQ
ncbi:hypothetical protein FQR65_LT20318 [Abscondita terminalis]|nr:hypothetical protein FQR65_LT20318 [Abscondita terminalis]